MNDRKTTALQERLIVALDQALGDATLTGGAALAAFYTRQRTTRDIDLFFHGHNQLDEILVNKVVALLSRNELRDLADVLALVRRGGSLSDALAQAPKKDAGFSPLTLAWALRGWPIERLARLGGHSEDETKELLAFRDELVAQLLAPLVG